MVMGTGVNRELGSNSATAKKQKAADLQGFLGVSDGTRTRDRLDHNQRPPVPAKQPESRFRSGVWPGERAT